MKRTSLIVAGIVLTLTFTGCTKGSSTSDVGNKPSETALTFAETKTAAEKSTKEPSTKEATTSETKKELTTENRTEEPTTDAFVENPTVEHTEEYNAEEAKKKFAESDIPDSIKNIFLSDGVFVDTVTQTEMKLSEYKLYEIIFDWKRADEIEEWNYYVAVDFDGDGKKELFYDVKLKNSDLCQRVIFHEHSDGKVYAYRHPSVRVNVSKDGDVLASAGAMYPSYLLRYGFDTEKIIETKITDYERQVNGGFKYYADGHEVDQAEYGTYLEHFWEKRLDWTEFRVMPDSDENQASGN